ncbi:xylulokinase [Acutalibacter intestini]|uniref:xylulokinase n=1 Tax=Acutalibacter intestini TaxID=3093659 RepID=UPI002AC956C8|nr:FGGY-family carbohydrate kinase [Acutalibacter sp. M00204]
MERKQIAAAIEAGQAALGIELGSTRIKAVLIGPDCQPAATGAFDWENRLEDGLWTYRLEDVWTGIQAAYRQMAQKVRDQYGVVLTRLGALGVSAMMHGYLPFDQAGNQLCGFRTWRNTVTEKEAEELTALFHFNIPQRWSIAHLYRALRLKEPHVGRIAYLTTLAGYVHWQLTGEKCVGVGEAAGMFPIDSETGTFDSGMMSRFDEILAKEAMPYRLGDILPQVLPAGESAGTLTAEGAKLLDPTGALCPGVPLCPPEGDAGTGMTATNSVAPRTGNISAGTSIFAMVVLERPLSQVYPEIDMVTTPTGRPVAMVHCNTCTSDLDAWVGLFAQLLEQAGTPLPKPKLYDLLYEQALTGAPDCGGVVSFNCYSGEPVIGLASGQPMLTRQPQEKFALGDFMRAQLYAAMTPLKLGMDILIQQEKVAVEELYGHGGLFKTPKVGQRLMAGALNVPVSVMETAGEGGPWGMALLAMFMKERLPGQALEDFLNQRVFAGAAGSRAQPQPEDVTGFAAFAKRYQAYLPAEKLLAGAM